MNKQNRKQIAVFKDNDPVAFQQAVNDFLQTVPGVPDVTYPDGQGLCAIIKYDATSDNAATDPDQSKPADHLIDLTDENEADVHTVTITLKVNPSEDRYCCECDNYNWGKNCPYRKGRVARMDPACDMFNVTITKA